MKLKQYLYSQLSITFFPIFLGLFFITSIIFLVKIASLTSIITLDFLELFKLFAYATPQIIFYTLPISFFISLVITLSKLSSEYELAVITSFGLNPLKIVRIYFPITFIISLFLLVVSVGLIPKTKFLTTQFLDFKKKEAHFNIKASQFGQKFGEWLIYIGSQNDTFYKEIKLFQNKENKQQFILSKTATLNNNEGDLSFKLNSGKAFIIENSDVSQIDFKSMYINDSIAGNDMENFTTSYEFWKEKINNKKDMDDFSFFILTSIFPTISLFLIATFGYFNPRYEKNRAVPYSLVAIVLYYVIVKAIDDKLFLHSLYIIPIIWIVGTYILYSKTTKQEY